MKEKNLKISSSPKGNCNLYKSGGHYGTISTNDFKKNQI